jgi:hypothetical protein
MLYNIVDVFNEVSHYGGLLREFRFTCISHTHFLLGTKVNLRTVKTTTDKVITVPTVLCGRPSDKNSVNLNRGCEIIRSISPGYACLCKIKDEGIKEELNMCSVCG